MPDPHTTLQVLLGICLAQRRLRHDRPVDCLAQRLLRHNLGRCGRLSGSAALTTTRCTVFWRTIRVTLDYLKNGLAGGTQCCTGVTHLAIALKTTTVSMSPPLHGEVTIHVQRLAPTVNVSDANAVPTPSIVHQATTTTCWHGLSHSHVKHDHRSHPTVP